MYPPTHISRVGQNHIYTVNTRYFWQGYHYTYGHIRCIYTVLANPTYKVPNQPDTTHVRSTPYGNKLHKAYKVIHRHTGYRTSIPHRLKNHIPDQTRSFTAAQVREPAYHIPHRLKSHIPYQTRSFTAAQVTEPAYQVKKRAHQRK